MKPMFKTLAEQLGAGRISSRQLVEECLDRATAANGEGARTFISVDAAPALRLADAVDAARKAGTERRPFAGIPVSVKDLFDVAGQVTSAGSIVLRDQPPASQDAPAVGRLKAAGLIVVGRTNMTEFAYSGLGINPHHGTPANRFDRASKRIPGGSSSGAAISVTDGMAMGALGTDTGGSCRIPAALNGLVGYKPTASAVPLQGCMPLSPSLDSAGPIAHSVQCCASLYTMLSGLAVPLPGSPGLARGLKLGIPQAVVLDGLDANVAHAFQRAVERLSASGASVRDLALRAFAELAPANAKGGLVAAQAYAAHKERLSLQGELYDPRVRLRIEKGATQSTDDYEQLHMFRASWIRSVLTEMQSVDFLLCPTVPMIAPTIAELEDEVAYGHVNLAMLRNPTFANFLDGCAISLPCHACTDAAPVGLMLMGRNGDDARLLAAAHAIESIVAPESI